MTCCNCTRSPATEQIVGKFLLDNDAISLMFAQGQCEHFSRSFVQVHRFDGRGFSAIERAQREITSEARCHSRIVRRAVSRAPSTLGGSAASMRRQVPAL